MRRQEGTGTGTEGRARGQEGTGDWDGGQSERAGGDRGLGRRAG